jgi:hypothetical protein
MNIFKILSSYDGSINEPNISSFLAYLLDPFEDHGLSDILLKEILVEATFENQTIFKDIFTNSKFSILVQPEYSVKFTSDSIKKRRDIEILIEILDNNIPIYSFCIEIKISDSSILKKDNQLEEELKGIRFHYEEDKNKPEIFFIFITDKPSSKSQEYFSKFQYHKKIHLFWRDHESSIVKKIQRILQYDRDGVIDPINEQSKYLMKSFLAFASTGFKSKIEEKSENNEKNNYGKPVIELMSDFAKTLEKEKEYSLDYLRNEFSRFVNNVSKITILNSTRNAHFTTSIINDRNRGHYNVKDPTDRRKNIFYYPNEDDRKVIKIIENIYPPRTKIYFKNSESNDIDYIMTDDL